MNPEAAAQRRDRRVYIRKDKDAPILKSVADDQFVTVEIVAEDAKRNIISVRRRMLSLYRAGILNRARRDRFSAWLYFLSEKGSALALTFGVQAELRFIKSKSSILVPHDLEITLFHRALRKKLHDTGHILTEWEQWRGATEIGAETENGAESIIPDARFRIDDEPHTYLEVTKSYQSEYDENGRGSIEKKLRVYNALWRHTRQEFRVLILMPTKLRVANFLAKIEDEFPYRRFWFTDEESYRTNMLGKIWWTARDFREATYSLLP
jgi:hypothetical protein